MAVGLPSERGGITLSWEASPSGRCRWLQNRPTRSEVRVRHRRRRHWLHRHDLHGHIRADDSWHDLHLPRARAKRVRREHVVEPRKGPCALRELGFHYSLR